MKLSGGKKLLLAGLLVLLVAEIAYLIVPTLNRSKDDLLTLASQSILRACENNQHRPTCYDREIPKLMNRFTLEDVFAVTKRIQSQDQSYAYCHVLGHAVSAAETKKDPSLWREVITRCPSGVCSNGCVHGAFQERFRTDVLPDHEIEVIKPDLLTVCEPRDSWKPTSLEQATCYHALGHLLMYITGADLTKSVGLCDQLAGVKDGSQFDFRHICYDGAFMQIFQPLEPEDRALVAGKQPAKADVSAYCSVWEGQRQVSCISESWPLFLNELQDPSYLSTFCGQLPSDFSPRCYTGMFYILVVQFRFDLSRMKVYCDGLPQNLSGACYANTASRLIETDWGNVYKAAAWCKDAGSVTAQQDCYQELAFYASYNFHMGSPEFYSLCEALPEPWKDACLKGSTEGNLKPVNQ